MLPVTCRIKFDDPHCLHEFNLIVTPDEGYWQGGRFTFHIYITEDYNMAVSLLLLTSFVLQTSLKTKQKEL